MGPLGNQLNQLVGGGCGLPVAFNVEAIFKAVRELNAMADKARQEGWTVNLDGADYVYVEVKRDQKGDAR